MKVRCLSIFVSLFIFLLTSVFSQDQQDSKKLSEMNLEDLLNL